MPLPLIPVILLGGAAVSASKGVYDIVNGVSQINQHQQKYKHHRALYDYQERGYLRRRSEIETSLQELGRQRLQAMVLLHKAVAFLKRARLTTVPADDELVISEEELEHWNGVAVQALDVLHGLATSAGAAAATASTVYGLAGAIGTASTGTAISTLSGAAATNATLAWFGGGALAAGGGGMALGTMVLGGVVAGPAVLVGGFFVAAKAEQVKTEIVRHIAAMDIAMEKMRLERAAFDQATQRIDEITKNMQRLVLQVETVLADADIACEQDVYTVYRLGKALADVVKLPVLIQANAQE